MGAVKNKKTIKPKKKIATKKEKIAKRVSRMQKIIEYRKKLKRARKGKVVPIKNYTTVGVLLFKTSWGFFGQAY